MNEQLFYKPIATERKLRIFTDKEKMPEKRCHGHVIAYYNNRVLMVDLETSDLEPQQCLKYESVLNSLTKGSISCKLTAPLASTIVDFRDLKLFTNDYNTICCLFELGARTFRMADIEKTVMKNEEEYTVDPDSFAATQYCSSMIATSMSDETEAMKKMANMNTFVTTRTNLNFFGWVEQAFVEKVLGIKDKHKSRAIA